MKKSKLTPAPRNEPVSKNLSFQQVDVSKAPPKVAENVRKSLSIETSSLIADDGKFWVFITRGQKPTGGYSVNISRVVVETGEEGSSRLKVFYVYRDPKPSQFVTQALTYPAELIRIEGLKERPAKIEFIKSE